MQRVAHGLDKVMDEMQADGYCDSLAKKIVVIDFHTHPGWAKETEESIADYSRAVMRHEIIHAFLNESGLSSCTSSESPWAKNEEMVDWFALQWPKIMTAFNAAGAI